MKQHTCKKSILLTLTTLLLSACGGSSVGNLAEHQDDDKAQGTALNVLTNYVENHRVAPVVQDYLDAEIKGVSSTNIAAVNEMIAALDPDEVDTQAEVQALVNKLATQADEVEEQQPETIVDKSPPVISIIGSNPITLIKGSIYTDQGATANDNIDGIVAVTSSGEVNNDTVGTYYIQYTAVDKNDNQSSETRVISVVAPPQNNAPTVSSVLISGTAKVGSTITVNYTFFDKDKDEEGRSIIAWTTSNKALQKGNDKSFTLSDSLAGSEITAWIQPVDSKGKVGEAVQSNTLYVQTETIVPPKDTEITPGVATGGFGAARVSSTPLSKEALFVANDGEGDSCTEELPCDIEAAKNKAVAGDIVFFRGGVYSMTLDNLRTFEFYGGTEGAPITYESYPGEKAIIDGSSLPRGYAVNTGVYLYDSFVTIRNMEVSGMPGAGIRINGNFNIIEGVEVHNNNGSGIHVTNGVDGPSASSRGGSNNIIRNNVVHDNSDAGLMGLGGYNDGNNSDGIVVSHGVNNLISHNTVYGNSDDGIDTWISNYSVVEYNLVYNQGRASGDGNGIKLGGLPNSYGSYAPVVGIGAIARNNIVFDNRSEGISCNHGKNVRMDNNTVYNNGTFGFWTCSVDNIAKNNISVGNPDGNYLEGTGSNNSWDMEGGEARFISTDRSSALFLKPVAGSDFDGIGAHFK